MVVALKNRAAHGGGLTDNQKLLIALYNAEVNHEPQSEGSSDLQALRKLYSHVCEIRECVDSIA
jgi:hypothetical protein